ncbi:predicted protein [Uncinocarpus reesii 1704]|uniref:Uncharacterized protein n=1 Tax=Uncinocarpus reesii (strain UAMH 1704) TaxID=336963 RepID=C4JHV1_UNCRE|nr:uncharacterized protein UREG_02787 [Uncinocarpus reesii 1704]EEP77938.1 predicted protein [Uncinocarpus reesii 1704]
MKSADPFFGITTDVGESWKTAISRYEDATSTKITSLTLARSVDDILAEVQDRETRFKERRHDGSKTDRFRTLLHKSLKPLERLCEIVTQSGSSVFPPGVVIFTASVNIVSADYDKVVEFFEDVNFYLNTLKVLETKVPPIKELKNAITEVLTSVLMLCGIFAKYVKMKRFAKALRSLGSDADDELAAAYGHFRKAVEQEAAIVRNATLVAVEQLKMETDEKSALILDGTKQVYSYLRDQGQEEDQERENILKGLSSLTFDGKQRDKFAEHYDGTRESVLRSDGFQRWLQGDQNSTLWCYGIHPSLSTIFRKTYIFVDALDECPETNRNIFLRLLKDLEPVARLFFTSRPNITPPVTFTGITRIEISTTKSEIETYLASEIKKNDRLARFITKDPKLKQEIIESVSQKAAGMFLLAYFQIRGLGKQNSLRGVRRAISAMPTGIYDTYKAAISRIEKEGEENCEAVKRALSYIYCAKRPLTVDELVQALAVELEDTDLDEDAAPETDFLLSASAGLIRIDEKRNVISLVHHTLQEFFEANPEHLLPDLEAEFGRLCLTYLSFDVFEDGPSTDGERLKQRLQHYQFYDYASRNWGYHTTELQIDEQTDIVIPYLENSQKLSSSIQVLHLTSYRKKNWYDRFPRHFGPLHVGAYWNLKHIVRSFLEAGFEVNSQDSYGNTALQVAAKNGHREMVQLLLENGANLNLQNRSGETALYWAARSGHRETVEFLVVKGANVLSDHEGWTALSWAIVGGHVEVVKVLLDKSAEFGAERDGKHKALFLAAEEGHDKLVQVLLDSGADVDARDHFGSTALDFAVSVGNEPTVRVLLQNKVNVNLEDGYQNSALHWAVPYPSIMQLLLNEGADPQAKNNRNQSALCWTAQGGSVEVARMLIAAGAGVNTQDYLGVTPLHRAALRGSKAMAWLLLENGADPNLKDDDGWTALHGAALQKHETLVGILLDKVDNGKAILEWVSLQARGKKQQALLAKTIATKMQGSTVVTGLREAVQESQIGRLQVILEKGADVNGQDPGGWTALMMAAESGYTDAVRFLLEEGADANIRECGQRTALWYAINRVHEPAITLLIEYGADVNASVYGVTPTMLAIERGSMAIVKLLLDAGANMDAQDYHGQTALHISALNGQGEILKLLAEKGADLTIVDDIGRSPLMLAVNKHQNGLVKLLLETGAGVEAKAQDGSTALHLATFLGHDSMVELLLQKGADVNAKTRDNLTALHIATLSGFGTIEKLLLTSGANTQEEVRWSEIWKDKPDRGCEYDTERKTLTQLLYEFGPKRGLDFVKEDTKVGIPLSSG